MLSHGHYDHFGGLAGFLRQSKGRLRAKLPFYVGGEECFCSREWTAPPVKGNFGALDREALAEADVTVTFAEGRRWSPTTPSPPARSAHHLREGALAQHDEGRRGARAGLLPRAAAGGAAQPSVEIPDQFQHEIATAYNLKGKGWSS